MKVTGQQDLYLKQNNNINARTVVEVSPAPSRWDDTQVSCQ